MLRCEDLARAATLWIARWRLDGGLWDHRVAPGCVHGMLDEIEMCSLRAVAAWVGAACACDRVGGGEVLLSV